jgi:hypothetical protein
VACLQTSCRSGRVAAVFGLKQVTPDGPARRFVGLKPDKAHAPVMAWHIGFGEVRGQSVDLLAVEYRVAFQERNIGLGLLAALTIGFSAGKCRGISFAFGEQPRRFSSQLPENREVDRLIRKSAEALNRMNRTPSRRTVLNAGLVGFLTAGLLTYAHPPRPMT